MKRLLLRASVGCPSWEASASTDPSSSLRDMTAWSTLVRCTTTERELAMARVDLALPLLGVRAHTKVLGSRWTLVLFKTSRVL